MRYYYLVASLVLSVLSIPSFAGFEVNAGVVLPHTGSIKELGAPTQRGVDLAVAELARAGLTVNLFNVDSGSNSDTVATAVHDMLDLNKDTHIPVIIGGVSSGVTLKVATEVTLPGSMLIVSPVSTSPVFTNLPADEGVDLVFRTIASDALQGKIAGTLAAQEVKTVSILYVDNPYGRGLTAHFREAFEANGGKVLAMVPHDENEVYPSYETELQKALAGQPEMVAAYSYPEHAKVYVKEAINEFGFKNFLFCDGTRSQELIDEVGSDHLEGLWGTSHTAPQTDELDAFTKLYMDAYGMPPSSSFAANAYDAMAVVGLAAQRVLADDGDLTSASIRDNLRAVANPPGVLVGPHEIEKAFQLIWDGTKINYTGASGNVDFDQAGEVVTSIEIWHYVQGTIETLKIYDSF